MIFTSLWHPLCGGRLRRILNRLDQVRPLIARIVDARIDGMVNNLSHGKRSRELDGHGDFGLTLPITFL